MPSKFALSYWRFSKRAMKVQNYKTFLILDFEATCEAGRKIEPQEIIEFPCLKVNAKTLQIDSIFHRYVRPTHPLTSFCSKLTGITQEMVDSESLFSDVLLDFLQWAEEQKLWDSPTNSLFVTCGEWDLQTMLPDQCRQLNIPVPQKMKQWVNIKKMFAEVMNTFPKKDLLGMMSILELPLQGRLHSGIDDCRNIHTILCELVKRDCILRPTSCLES